MKQSEKNAYRELIDKMLERADAKTVKTVYEFVLSMTS